MKTGSWSSVGELLLAGRVKCPWIDLGENKYRTDWSLQDSGRLVDLTTKRFGGNLTLFTPKKLVYAVHTVVYAVYAVHTMHYIDNQTATCEQRSSLFQSQTAPSVPHHLRVFTLRTAFKDTLRVENS